MLASLPMYDHPAIRPATDRFWGLIRQAYGDGPQTLTRSSDLWDHWRSPDLLLSQTCGLPFRAHLFEQVTLVGTPDFGLKGTAPGWYFSVVIARADGPATIAEARETTLAYNEPLSQSGWACVADTLGFGVRVQSGSHLGSAQMVATGSAEVAAIDAVTWRLIERFGDLGPLVVIGQTDPTPGLPYITAKTRDPAPLALAIGAALAALSPQDQQDLGITRLAQISAATYCSLPLPARAPA